MRLLTTLLLTISLNAWAQTDRKMSFPDVDGYETIISDLHMHTVFSDGSVWPDIRVYEAVRDGLDLIATTEHLEYQPHSDDIPHPNRNRSYELASKIAERDGLMVINGSEITRSMPPGHSNAGFIQDANKLLNDDAVEVFREANRQGAFTFWNHPMWTAHYEDGIAKLTDLHRQLISEKLLHGIEVVNEHTYSEEALQIALDNNLTILGTSDIHGLIDWEYEVPQGGHRPVTLILSKSRSENDLKDALFSGRTIAWFKDMLIARPENMRLILDAALEITDVEYRDIVAAVRLKNHTPVNFTLENTSEYGFHTDGSIVSIPAHATIELQVKTGEVLDQFSLEFRVLNAVTAPKTHPEITLRVSRP